MDNTTYIALSRQQALWNQLEVVANNLANVNTTGFKGSDTLFSQYVFKSRGDDRTFKDKVAFTHDFGLVRNLAQGTFNYTGNTLDLALQGEGYFVVQKIDNGQLSGEDLYTRAGAFTVNADSQLVTQSGQAVLGTDGQPIVIPPNAGEITIQGDGAIKSRASGETGTIRTLGTLRVVRFESERELKAVDGTAFSAGDQQPIDIARPTVAQGVLEDSNVNAITEMTRLINVNRAYADIAKLVDEEHQRKRQAADTFTRQVTA
jgi:flagellar basal-body rod protein FlgF